eukprot:scaffold114_cov88-Isochrysis_galbana.AAC.1
MDERGPPPAPMGCEWAVITSAHLPVSVRPRASKAQRALFQSQCGCEWIVNRSAYLPKEFGLAPLKRSERLSFSKAQRAPFLSQCGCEWTVNRSAYMPVSVRPRASRLSCPSGAVNGL